MTRYPRRPNTSRLSSVTATARPSASQDVADVTDSVANIRAGGYLNGKRAITIIIFRQPGANIIETVDRLRAELDSIKASIPAGIDITVVLDRTTTIRASVNDVERTLVHCHRSRHPGRLHVPAQWPRHPHPRHRRSGFAARHLARSCISADTASIISP